MQVNKQTNTLVETILAVKWHGNKARKQNIHTEQQHTKQTSNQTTKHERGNREANKQANNVQTKQPINNQADSQTNKQANNCIKQTQLMQLCRQAAKHTHKH